MEPAAERMTQVCPRCGLVNELARTEAFCRRCGVAMLVRPCLACEEPLFGPELLHVRSVVVGGPNVLR
jgi:hypothetical protein